MIFFFGLQKRSSKVVADRQIRRQGRAFEHYFGSRGREFKRSIRQKFKCPWFARGGGGCWSFSWSVHKPDKLISLIINTPEVVWRGLKRAWSVVDCRWDLRGYPGQLVSPDILLFVWYLLVHYIDEQLVPVFTNIINVIEDICSRGFYQDQLGNDHFRSPSYCDIQWA